jgi:hypothetical protein
LLVELVGWISVNPVLKVASLEAVAVALVVAATVEAASGVVVVAVEAASPTAVVAVEVADAADSQIVAAEGGVETPQTAVALATLPARRSPSRAPVLEFAQAIQIRPSS